MGFACTTLPFAKLSQADEMWSVNFAWRYDVPRIDRLFEIHPIEVLAFNGYMGDPASEDRKHFKWLQKEQDFILYTYADYTGPNVLDKLGDLLESNLAEEKITEEVYNKYSLQYAEIIKDPPRFPSSVPYPFEILDDIFENFNRENRPGQVYMPSTISYMLAMAIHEGFDRIEMYGVEMATDAGGAMGTEYVYQKAGTEALLMYAMGKGIEVYLPEHCKLMNIKPYHKGLQMITRQTLESMKKQYEQFRVDSISQNNHFRGQVAGAEKKWGQKIKNLNHNWENDKTKALKNKLDEKAIFDLDAGYEKRLKEMQKESEAEVMPLIKSVGHHQGKAIMADANTQMCTHLISTIDYDNPVVELVYKFSIGEERPVEEKPKKEKVLA